MPMRKLAAGLLALLALSAPAVAKPVLAISQIVLADTSGEKPNAAGLVWSHIKSLTATISTGLVPAYDVKLVAKADCQDYSEACLGKWARGTGGNLILIGTVLKMTPTVSHFWVGVFKPDGKTRVFYRDITINSDADSSWRSAGSELVSALLAAKLAP